MRDRRAGLALVVACLCWGCAFPLMESLGRAHRHLGDPLGWNAWLLTLRFLAAALIVAAFAWRGPAQRDEWLRGIGFGVFTALGTLLQMDGLAFCTSAVSAILTQAYVLPLIVTVALRDRRWPSAAAWAAAACVLGGSALIAGPLGNVGFGRGEIETLLAGLCFTAQFLWLERPARHQRLGPVLTISFLTAAVTFAAIALPLAGAPGPVLQALDDPRILLLHLALILIPTVLGMALMLRFQARVGAVSAAMIYAGEPIIAWIAAAALVGPLALVPTTPTWTLVLGALAILTANLVAQAWLAPGRPGSRIDAGGGPPNVPHLHGRD